jgi:hypothetical protein
MSDERNEKEDPAEQFKQGLGLLWRAARGAAVGVKREMDKTDLGRSIEDAGRELARAATNVVGRISSEIGKRPGKPWEPAEDRSGEVAGDQQEDDEFDGVKAPKKRGEPGPGEPGFRIMVDDDDKTG